MAAAHMLPGNSTPFERALSLSTDVLPTLLPPAQAMRGVKLRLPPDSFLPFLHFEYGLGPLTPFLSARDVISEGLDWQRILGTPAAINQALGWIGHGGAIEVFPTRRRRWNLFMLEMAAMPAAEEPDLKNIETLTQLSVPLRSKFWRGFKTHDIRAVDWGYSTWSNVNWSTYSGARITPEAALWSFGREYESVRTLSEAELTALGVWIPVGGAPLTWGSFSWDEANAPWASNSALTRKQLMTAGIINRSVWIKFEAAGGQTIGYRRAKVARGVIQNNAGVYTVGGTRYAPETVSPQAIYLEFQTDFGDGFGATAAQWSLVIDADPVDETKPGILWGGPTALDGGTEFAETAQALTFKRTVRERFRVLLNF